MRKTSGVVLIAMGVILLAIGYLMPASNSAVEPEQQSDIVVSQPVSPGPGPIAASDGWRTHWRAEAVSAAESRPTPIVVRLPIRPLLLPPPKVAAAPSDHASLARALQQELKRVGCYEGQLDANWTSQTRKAMQTFNDRVNATLPVGEPNEILLRLVQNQQERVCGAPCPPGQGFGDEGRCLPNAILAQVHKKALLRIAVTQPINPTAPVASTSRTIASWSITATTMTPSFPLPGNQERMSLAGPIAPTNAISPSAMPVRAASSAPRQLSGHSRKKFGQSFFRALDQWGLN